MKQFKNSMLRGTILLIKLLHILFLSDRGIADANNSACHRSHPQGSSKSLDILWINLDKEVERKASMISMLQSYGLIEQSKRFSAITPQNLVIPNELQKSTRCSSLSSDAVEQELRLLSNRKADQNDHNTTVLIVDHCSSKLPRSLNELATTVSHLLAIFLATKQNPSRKFALIAEDDLSFAMDINFDLLIGSAPSDFSTLQLSTNHERRVRELWDTYRLEGKLWELRHGKPYWSTNAYLINKEVIRPVINSIVQQISPSLFTLHLHATNQYCPGAGERCCRSDSISPIPPCIRSENGYAADFFVYSLLHEQTYIITFPIIVNNENAKNSSIHQSHVGIQQTAVKFTKSILNSVITSNLTQLPNFLYPQCLSKELAYN